MNCIKLLSSVLVALALAGCIPNGKNVTEKRVAMGSNGLAIVERCTTKTLFMPFTPEGMQTDYPRSQIWSYWFLDAKGTKREIIFLRRERMGFGVELHRVSTENRWLAIDVLSNGLAKVILFSDAGMQDERQIHFDSLANGSWSLTFSDGNQKLAYAEGGRRKELLVGNTLKEANP